MSGFFVSFRVRHANRDLSNLFASLGLIPTQSWKAGEQRVSPTGLSLGGIHNSSYYCCDLPLQDSDDLAEWLDRAIDLLNPFAEQLAHITKDGGSLCFFVSLESGVFEGTTLSPSLLARLSTINTSLDIDRSF